MASAIGFVHASESNCSANDWTCAMARHSRASCIAAEASPKPRAIKRYVAKEKELPHAKRRIIYIISYSTYIIYLFYAHYMQVSPPVCGWNIYTTGDLNWRWKRRFWQILARYGKMTAGSNWRTVYWHFEVVMESITNQEYIHAPKMETANPHSFQTKTFWVHLCTLC